MADDLKNMILTLSKTVGRSYFPSYEQALIYGTSTAKVALPGVVLDVDSRVTVQRNLLRVHHVTDMRGSRKRIGMSMSSGDPRESGFVLFDGTATVNYATGRVAVGRGMVYLGDKLKELSGDIRTWSPESWFLFLSYVDSNYTFGD